MEDFVQFGSGGYWALGLVLVFARGMDFLSTWLATPNLVLEGNPLAKRLGWKWGIALNIGICALFALWPLPSVVVATTSLLVASRNFQSAWLMRSMGEEAYRDWHVSRVQEAPIGLYLSALAGNTLLIAAVGGALMFFSNFALVPFGIGLGIVAYAAAVAFYTLLAVWRLRRQMARETRLLKKNARRNEQPLGDFVLPQPLD
jgi:hypothetical protein